MCEHACSQYDNLTYVGVVQRFKLVTRIPSDVRLRFDVARFEALLGSKKYPQTHPNHTG